MTDRPEPIEAIVGREAACLGCAMIDPGSCGALILSGLCETDFVGPLNRSVMAAIRRLSERREGVEYASVAAELVRGGTMHSLGNAGLLVSAMGEGVMLSNDMLRRCELIKAATAAHRKAAAK